ncbi:hypothetical protein MMC25_003201 [Agyrium rufum]|nr:hypothetical protein [Agyrium rufum]
MSAATASSWLKSQRKSDLVAIAEKSGLEDYDSLKKADLESALDTHLRANRTSLAKESSLTKFYDRLDTPGSPVKRDTSTALVTLGEEIKKPKPRRQTRGRSDFETDHSDPETDLNSVTAIATRTPARALAFAQQLPLPPSPAVLVDKIDQQTASIRASTASLWRSTGIPEAGEDLREKLSSTASIETLFLLLEVWGLQGPVLPMKSLTLIPASEMLGTPALPGHMPDFFVLLDPKFWETSTLWFTTSIFVPLLLAYFCNLSMKAKHGKTKGVKVGATEGQIDPLIFNISKGLLTWLIYGKRYTAGGWIGQEAVNKLESAFPGGHRGVMIGSGVGALTSLYEAVLKK